MLVGVGIFLFSLLSKSIFVMALGMLIALVIGLLANKLEDKEIAERHRKWEQKERAAAHVAEQERKKAQEQREQLVQHAQTGNPAAMHELGLMILSGNGFIKNEEIAAKWFLEAAKRNHRDSQQLIAEFYEKGVGVTRDRDSAFEWYKLAAKQGSVTAQKRVDEIAAAIAVELKQEEERNLLGVSAEQWEKFRQYLDVCESEPELLLLRALIKSNNLKPHGRKLAGKITVEPQAKVLRYRVDFLINEHFVVEVDGEKYHNNPASFETDRYRDQDLLMNGFKTIRFPARQIYADPERAASVIFTALQNS